MEKVRVTILLDPDCRENIQRIAEREKRSFSSQVAHILQGVVNHQKAKGEK